MERNAAFNIIGYTIRQGLAHPLSVRRRRCLVFLGLTFQQCLPTIVAIECSWDPVTSKRAFALHTELHTKHAQLIHTHFLQCATEAFEYQQHLKDTTLPPRGLLTLISAEGQHH